MIAAMLATTLLLAADPGPNTEAAALVARLGADRYADRERAAEALRTLGPDALPALRDALSDGDAEIRNRAEVLLDRIEAEMLTRPTPVRLDAHGRPLEEVVKDLADRLGFEAELA